MREKFKELKKKHPDAILLFREGSFYVSIFEDAPEVARILNLDLTFLEDNISAAFPHQALDTYLPKLIRAGKRVAIVDKTERTEKNKPEVKQLNEKKMEVKQIPLGDIVPSPMNPRKTFDENALKELADNIKNQGLLQPITVRPKDDKYEIVCGERRYRACSLNETENIPCIVKDMTDEEAFDAMITENLQRKDVDPMEEAFAFSQLVAQGKTTDEIALRFGKSKRFIQERIKLDKLLPELKKKVTDGDMAIGAAMLICKLTEDEQRDFYEDHENDTEVDKYDAESYIDRLFMTISRAPWDGKFQGPCKCVCSKCQFNDCNAGNLFYSMKQHEARCTNRDKFDDKTTDWNFEIIRRNADLLVKTGDPLEAGKTVILYECQGWFTDMQKKQVSDYIEKAKEMGYEVKENTGRLFDRYSHYDEEDERLQVLIAENKVYRCLFVSANYNGLYIDTRYYRFCKNVTGEEANEAEAMKLVQARKEAISKNGAATAKKLRGLLSSMEPTDIKTYPLTQNETYILTCLMLADTSYDFRNSRNVVGYTDDHVTITEYVKEHPTEVHQIAREYMRTKLAGSGVEYYSHLQECQKLLIQEWKSLQADEVTETMERKLNDQLAKIDEKLTALGYDSEGKKLQ